MRSTFTRLMEATLIEDSLSALILGDIGVHSFRNSLTNFPERVFNIGILEQAMIGVAAGLAKSGLRPVVHTIAPFLVERALEQIKVDLAYNALPARLVSVGSSFDYASLGATHHCPGDVMALTAVPEVSIVVPGSPVELEALFRSTDGLPKTVYFRLSESSNRSPATVQYGEPTVLQRGAGVTVVSVGPACDIASEAVTGLDVTHVYLTTLRPLNLSRIGDLLVGHKLLIVEPLYRGTTLALIAAALPNHYLTAKSIGFDHQFDHNYGQVDDHLRQHNFTARHIRDELLAL